MLSATVFPAAWSRRGFQIRKNPPLLKSLCRGRSGMSWKPVKIDRRRVSLPVRLSDRFVIVPQMGPCRSGQLLILGIIV